MVAERQPHNGPRMKPDQLCVFLRPDAERLRRLLEQLHIELSIVTCVSWAWCIALNGVGGNYRNSTRDWISMVVSLVKPCPTPLA